MAKNVDVFGFDELLKDFKKVEKNYPNKADALLAAYGKATLKRTKALTPIGTKKLVNRKQRLYATWRLKKVKLYKNGTVRVVRIQSSAPHAHLVEDGHIIARGGKTRERGKKLNAVELSGRGITVSGRVEGKHMLRNAISEARSRFPSDAEKLLNELVAELEV